MSRNLCEVTGLALTGYLASRLLSLELESEGMAAAQAEQVLTDAEEFCQKIETQFEKTAPDLWNETAKSERGMLKDTLKGLRERWGNSFESLSNWICQNASIS